MHELVIKIEYNNMHRERIKNIRVFCPSTNWWWTRRRWNFDLQDSVPPHFSLEVLNALDVRFSYLWIGRGRCTSCLIWSQDFLLLDFFLCWFVKNLIYGEKIQVYIIFERKLTQVSTNHSGNAWTNMARNWSLSMCLQDCERYARWRLRKFVLKP